MTMRLGPEESFLTLCLGGAVATTVATILAALAEAVRAPGWLAVAAVAIGLWFVAAFVSLRANADATRRGGRG
jgi:hypothetical protein